MLSRDRIPAAAASQEASRPVSSVARRRHAVGRATPRRHTTTRTRQRRFVEFGGFLLIDDAHPEDGSFDRGVRRELAAMFGSDALHALPATHTIDRSFYLIERPLGRGQGPAHVEAIERGGRAAVVYSRHDLGGAWARDNLGNFLHQVVPGQSGQRERAFRLGVNLVMYALCLDYKDDQVHAPFIMRRRAGRP